MHPSTPICHGIQLPFLFIETEFFLIYVWEQNIVGLASNVYLGKICGNNSHVDADRFLLVHNVEL
jgi:hypothetical protein